MTEPTTSRGKFSELFEVITKYSQGDYDHQEQALRVIAGVYDVPFEAEAMPDARQVVDDILGQRDVRRAQDPGQRADQVRVLLPEQVLDQLRR